MPFKEFWKAQIFTENFYNIQSVSFWSNFDPNLPPEDGRNKSNKSKSRPFLRPISSENYNNFSLYLGFFRVQMCPVSKIKRSQLILAPLFQKPSVKG